MADSKITALTAISTVDPTADPLVIVDVSDTSMAASGTTKKSTINQLLGAGGTATLASATITGDLTVDTSTLKVDSANNRVGIGTASPTSKLHVFGSGTNTFLTISDVGANYNIALGTQNANIAQLAVFNTTIASGSKDFWLTALSHTFNTWDGSAYSNRFVIASDGVATWSNVGGVAGTAMTLNSTGLGVGASPSERITVNSSTAANYIKLTNSGATTGFLIGCFNTAVDIRNKEAGAMNFFTSDIQRMQIDASGNTVLGTAAVATTATDGFLYVTGCAGTPTGTPTAKTGRVPIVVDTTNNKLYFYSGGSWVAAN